MAPKISPRSPTRASSRQTTSTKAHRSTFENQAQGRQKLVDDSSLKQHVLTGSSKSIEGKTALQLNQPSSGSRIGLNNRSQAHASASSLFSLTSLSRLPVELAEMVLNFGDFTPIQLMTLLDHKNSNGSPSNVSLTAWSNKYWASFAPQIEKNEAIFEGYHAQQFIKRYEVMSRETQDLLNTLWTETKEKKIAAFSKIKRKSSLLNNYDIMRAAVSSINGLAFYYADENLKGDKGIVLAAVGQDGSALAYASENLQGDYEIVFAAVSQDGSVLKYADKKLQGDRKIVFAAVGTDGWALQFASEHLKSDYGIVFAAVEQNGWALQFASEHLKSDKGIVLAAVGRHSSALRFADPTLQRDPALRFLAGLPPLPER